MMKRDTVMNGVLSLLAASRVQADKVPPVDCTMHLSVFDIDGTLLVTRGREIVRSPGGLRSCVHPLVEECRKLLPNGTQSDYRFSGEEEYYGDDFSLLQTAAVIQQSATSLRTSNSLPCSEVAILTARGSSPGWIAGQLSKRLGLQQHIRPDLVKPVYNVDFERAMLDATGRLGSTAERKAFALGQLIGDVGPEVVTFLDDMALNLKEAAAYMEARHGAVRFVPELVPLQASIDACTEMGWNFLELIDFQCHDMPRSQSMNELVKSLQRCPLAERIHERMDAHARHSRCELQGPARCTLEQSWRSVEDRTHSY